MLEYCSIIIRFILGKRRRHINVGCLDHCCVAFEGTNVVVQLWAVRLGAFSLTTREEKVEETLVGFRMQE